MRRPLLVGSGLLTLLGGLGIAALMAWSPSAVDAQAVPSQAEVGSRVGARCPECGVVASIRRVDRVEYADAGGQPTTVVATASEVHNRPAARIGNRYEVTVRMLDGSSRVFMAENTPIWRPGERMIIIEGASQTVD